MLQANRNILPEPRPVTLFAPRAIAAATLLWRVKT